MGLPENTLGEGFEEMELCVGDRAKALEECSCLIHKLFLVCRIRVVSPA